MLRVSFPADQGDRVAEPYGSFVLHKCFETEGLPNDGYVVQVIHKRTSVFLPNGETLRTSEEIADMTKGGVLYASESYIESFRVKGGESIDCDNFQNGPILPYDDEGYPLTYEPNDPEFIQYGTSGNISMTGIIYYLDTSGMRKLKETVKWSRRRDTPANGLPYAPFTEEAEAALRSLTLIPPVAHVVRVMWDAGEPGVRPSKTDVESVMENLDGNRYNAVRISSMSGGQSKLKRRVKRAKK